MASSRYASYVEEEDWDLDTLLVVNSHLEKFVRMLPAAHAAELSLAELQDVAARQQAAMETQRQALAAREARLRLLQQQEARHRQLAAEAGPRLQRVRERVEAQETKLRRLRAARGQAEQYRASNGHLNSELEAVRALFNEKEKELALAVGKVDTLMRQLQELREAKVQGLLYSGAAGQQKAGHPHTGPAGALSAELERLRQELMHRHTVNEQQTSHLSTQRQLLQQRREESAHMDARIHELQQRLKKRRAQQGGQPGDRAATAGHPGPRPPGQGWKPGPNVAAVEPYIQYAPKDVVKDDLYSKTGGFHKQDPKYQTLPPGTKFIPVGGGDEGSHSGSGKAGGKAGIQEVNNNNEKGGSGGGGVKGGEYKIPALISSHFSAHRGGQSGSPANRTAAVVAAAVSQPSGVAGDAKSAVSSKPTTPTSTTQSSSPTPGPAPPQQQHVSRLPKGPRPFVNTFGGKSGLPKWPPDPTKKEEEEEPPAKPVPHQPPHHPQINIFDEERQAGSGQSSPASSEGSGPLVKQGSGVFVHPLAAHNPPGASVAQPGSCVAQPGSSVAQPGTSVAQPGTSVVQPGTSVAQPDIVPHPDSTFPAQQSGSSVGLSGGPPHEPQPAPRVVIPPHSASSGPSTDQQNSNQPGVIGAARTWVGEEVDSLRPGGNESVVNLGGPQATSTLQGAEGKTGSTVHLNQRPAPTYRYASKNVIANTYMGRLGSSALERYQQLNKQLYSTMDSHNSQAAGAQQPSGNDPPQKTLAGELRAAFSTPQQDPSLPDSLAGGGPGGMTQFGLVGPPSYPDIASDKGSFKANTPKHIRRRHSDSDSEDAAKTLHKHDKSNKQQHNTQPSSEDSSNNNNNNTTANAEGKTNSEASRANRHGGSSDNKANQGKGSKGKAPEAKAKQKKTILKGDNRRKHSNRVRFDPLALLLDASLEGELDLVSRTAKEVADVSTPNDEGITALHNAICAGHYDIVKFLIEFGADVNSPDSDGWTPLHCAASCNNLPMVRFLVEHGACIFATTISDNETAAEKCEEDEDGYDRCSDYLYSTQEKLGIANDGVVYAVFDYYVSNSDELAFHINDKLTVLRKGDDVEKEWWWARLTPSQEGYIPRNLLGLYPRVLPPNYQPQTSEC